jgi:hypothetical protein
MGIAHYDLFIYLLNHQSILFNKPWVYPRIGDVIIVLFTSVPQAVLLLACSTKITLSIAVCTHQN